MNKKTMIGPMKGKMRRIWLKIKKKSPEILLVTGIIATGAAVYTAIKGTGKFMEEAADIKKEEDDINEVLENGVDVTDEERERLTLAKKKIKLKLAKSAAKCYTGTAISLAAAIGAQVGQMTLHKKTKADYTALLATSSAIINRYKTGITERYGEQAEYEIRNGIKTEKIEEEVTDEKGKTKKVEKEVKKTDLGRNETYSKFFDCASREWVYLTDEFGRQTTKGDNDANMMFLKRTLEHFNYILNRDKVVFLNDVLRALDIPIVRDGWKKGWTYQPNNPYHKGDNYISFGIDKMDWATRRFVNGDEDCILLDFNLDEGLIEDFI